MINLKQIEKKWQKRWEKAKIFEANVDKKKKKFFTSLIIPYLNGRIHLGHGFTYLRNDSYARFKRMQGFNVLLAEGFHATGEPILGVVERLKKGDKNQIETLKMFGAKEKDLENFKKYGPEFAAKFWMKKIIEDEKNLGLSIDWRRTFVTAIDPIFNRFIEWQYNNLRKKGFVVQGTHPVVWCSHDQSPTGDHDRLVGEGESPIEYVILKFKLDSGETVPCATLRPETIYGVTNIWINPKIEYIWTQVNGEVWLSTKKVAEKLQDQLRQVKIIGKAKAEKLIGKYVTNPSTGNKIPILPATFVEPSIGTGIVMSVPSHAPYDWVALHNLQDKPEVLKKHGVPPALVRDILPISIIKVEGLGEHPAIEISEKMLIKDQDERDLLEKATSELYKKEYHLGTLKENTGYPGMKVSEVKEKLINDFISKKIAEKLWELTGKVICRCTTENHVKILENQWFLKFSDENWKALVIECINQMKFFPEEARLQFLNTVDWMKDKACARKSGLGTKLPWDKEWIVETLSDSTIYMAYYTIARIINSKKIPAENLTDEVFDFIFLGRSTAGSVARNSKVDKQILQEMRDEFEYFYPVDLRNSGKDLLQNHLTYFLFHHTAVWPKEKWPKAIGINGFVNVSGEKMAKSKGNIVPLAGLFQRHGSDITRINLISSNEDMDDADWREENIVAFRSRINFLYNLVLKISKAKRKEIRNVDNFLLSSAQRHIEDATKFYEELKFRSATKSVFFDLTNDLKWYVDRCGGVSECNKKVLTEFLNVLIRLNSPILPHFSEEAWGMLGNRGFVSLSPWPVPNKKLTGEVGELGEEFLRQVLSDVREIQKIMKVASKNLTIVVAPKWKFAIFLDFAHNKERELGQIIKSLRRKDEETVKYVQYLYKKKNQFSEKILDRDSQLKILNEAKTFLEKQLKMKVKVEAAEESKIEKAKNADVIKPAIFLG